MLYNHYLVYLPHHKSSFWLYKLSISPFLLSLSNNIVRYVVYRFMRFTSTSYLPHIHISIYLWRNLTINIFLSLLSDWHHLLQFYIMHYIPRPLTLSSRTFITEVLLQPLINFTYSINWISMRRTTTLVLIRNWTWT